MASCEKFCNILLPIIFEPNVVGHALGWGLALFYYIINLGE